jgi:xylose isomerase
MDLCARALLVAERMVTDGRPARELDARYAGWDGAVGKKLLAPGMSLDDVAAHALQRNVDERPVSGRQEAWENLVNEYI